MIHHFLLPRKSLATCSAIVGEYSVGLSLVFPQIVGSGTGVAAAAVITNKRSLAGVHFHVSLQIRFTGMFGFALLTFESFDTVHVFLVSINISYRSPANRTQPPSQIMFAVQMSEHHTGRGSSERTLWAL